MKKILVVLCSVMVFIGTVMPMIVRAEENMKKEDSVNISEDIKKQLGVLVPKETKDGDIEFQQDVKVKSIVRIYNIGLLFAFLEHSNIDEVLTSREVLQTYYAVEYVDESIKYLQQNNVILEDATFENEKAMKAFRNDEIIKKVSPDIEVYNTYYLSGETSHMGTAIYYVTNMGDYVYYIYYQLEGEFIFPIEDFCKYQKAIADEIRNRPYAYGGIDISGIWDLSKYNINSSEFIQSTDVIGSKLNHNQNVNSSIHTDDESSKVNKILFWVCLALGVGLLTGSVVYGGLYLHKKKA